MTTGAPVPDSYYEPIDEHRYKPTRHTSGAWDPDEQHFSPLGGLIVHAGQPSSPLASYLALVDTANGIAVRQPPTAWMFPNVDLTIHLHRQPEGRWTGLHTTVTFGSTGQGVTSTVLHDINGPAGHAQQILTIRPK